MKKFVFLIVCSLLLCCGYANNSPNTTKDYAIEKSISIGTPDWNDLSIENCTSNIEYVIYAPYDHYDIVFNIVDVGFEHYCYISDFSKKNSVCDWVYSFEHG
jgi:hypothetical protein